jgi:SnoaL-like protein
MERSTAIEDRTREVYGALERGDAAGVNALFSTQDGVLVIGTDPEEWWPGYDTITKIWETQLGEIGGIGVENADPRGYASGDAGWVADRPTLVIGGDNRIPLRITGVFTRENGEWKLAQWHASIGVSNEQSFGEDITTQIGDSA